MAFQDLLDKIDASIGAKRKRYGLFGPIEVYCPYCKKDVQLVRSKFNWILFIVLLILGGVGIFYLIIHILKSKTRCHICNAKVGTLMQTGIYVKKKIN